MNNRFVGVVFSVWLCGAYAAAEESAVSTNRPEAVEAMRVEETEEKVSEAEKEAVVAGMRSSGISMTAVSNRGGGVQSMTMRRGMSGRSDGPAVDDFEWAENLPPIHSDRVRISAFVNPTSFSGARMSNSWAAWAPGRISPASVAFSP